MIVAIRSKTRSEISFLECLLDILQSFQADGLTVV